MATRAKPSLFLVLISGQRYTALYESLNIGGYGWRFTGM